MRVCLHPGSRESTSGAAQLRRRSQLTVGGQLADVNIPTGGRTRTEEKKTHTAQCPRTEPRRTGPPSHPIPGHVLPPSSRMSVGAPRGLASSGQKPIAEIIHPLSAAEEPLSLSVSVGGDKVTKKSACKTSERRELKPSAGTCSGWISVKIPSTEN